MKKRITLLLTISMALILFLQPFIITISYATENGTAEGTVSQTFNDSTLYEALKNLLGGKASYDDEKKQITISNEEIKNITEIVLESRGITNLTGLNIFTNLIYLDLSANELDQNSNLEVINSFTNLQKLDLSSNKIENVESISSVLNKKGIKVDLQNQNIKVIEFIDIIRAYDADGAIDILNGKTQTQELKQILTAYENSNIKIEKLKADGKVIDSQEIENYVTINKEKKLLEFPPSYTNKYEITLSIDSDVPTNKTIAEYKVYRININSQEGMMFKDEELYKAVRDQLKDQNGSYNFENWTYDDEDLIIIADKMELDTVKYIKANSRAIKDLTGLENFVGLVELDLQDNSIISLNTISELYKNKQIRTETLRAQYKTLIKSVEEHIEEYNKLEEQIKKLNEELKQIKEGKLTGRNINEIQKEIEELNIQKKKEANLIRVTVSIIKRILDNLDSSIGHIVNAPAAYDEIKSEQERIEKNKEFNIEKLKSKSLKSTVITEQIAYLTTLKGGNGNKIEKLATTVNTLLDSYTDDEVKDILTTLELPEKVSSKEDESGNYSYVYKKVLTEDAIARIETNQAIQIFNAYLDGLDDEKDKEKITSIAKAFGVALQAEVTENGETKSVNKSMADLKAQIKEEEQKAYEQCQSKDEFEALTKLLADAVPKIDKTKFTESTSEENLFTAAKPDLINEFKTNLLTDTLKINETIIENTETALLGYVGANQIDYKILREKLNRETARLTETYRKILEFIDNDISLVNNTASNIIDCDDFDDNKQKKLALISQRLMQVSDEDINAVIRMQDLETLNLDRNMIVDTKELEEIPTIKVLILGHNLISKFNYEKYENLEYLDLNSNCIKNPTITKMSNIKYLNLSNNRINSVIGIELSGLPKLGKTIERPTKLEKYEGEGILDLGRNGIDDAEKLLKSTNNNLLEHGYSNLASAVKEGASIVSLEGQILTADIEITDVTGKESVDIELPRIFRQSKELQNGKTVQVQYEKVYPCTNVYSDGTKANLDATIKDTKREGVVVMCMSSQDADYFADGTTYIITYKVVSDTVAPVINEILASTTDWTNEPVTISINATDDKSSKLQYSFDDGKTWQDQNTKTYEENTSNILIQVKDEAGNIAKYQEAISITTIDKIAPVIKSVTKEEEKVKGETIITVEATDEGSGMSEYSFDGGITWQVSAISEPLKNTEEISIAAKDYAGNIATFNGEFNVKEVDYTEPTISNVDKKVENNTVILTVEATDEGTGVAGYSFDGGITWQQENSKTYSENTKGIQVTVKDNANNVATYPEIIDITEIQNQTEEEKEIEITSSKYSIDLENEYIGSIDAKTTVADLKSNIITNANNVIIKNAKGEEIEENGIIGTGANIEFTLEDEKKSLTAVVNGDLNGDGIIDDIDLLKLARYTVNIDKNLDGAYLKAADLSADGKIDDIDLLKLARTMVGLK